MLTFLLLLAALAPPAALAGSAPITRELLLKGCPIPERREFPLGPQKQACESFSEYVCGNAARGFSLPANRSYWSFAATDARERLLYAKKRYFELLGKGASPRTPRAAQIKQLYLSCMNLKARKAEEPVNLKREITKLEGVKTREQLMDFMAARYSSPEFTFVGFGPVANQKDPLVNDLLLAGAEFSLPEKSYYEEAAPLADLQALALAFFKTAGLDRPEERARWLVEFERDFAKAQPAPAEMRKRFASDTYRDRDLILSSYPNLRLEKLFARAPRTAPVRDYQPEALAFFSEALGKEPLEKLKSVVLFHSLNRFTGNVGSDLDVAYPAYYQEFFQFLRKHHGGPKERSPLDERCTSVAQKAFGMELDAELLPILFPGFPAEKARETAEKVRRSIIAGLEHNEWLSEEARSEAIKKIASARLQIVAPEKEKDWRFLPMASYSPKAYLANLRKVERLKLDRIFRELHAKRDRDEWIMAPLTVNAGYMPSDNRFVMPIAILQPPIFDPNGSDARNLGAMGAIVGHELGHGIDDQGSRYDFEGKVRSWMSEKDLDRFASRSKGFVELFDSLGHNGQLTLGENIGDHVGLTFAYSALFPKGEPAGGGGEQAREFYLSYASSWCTVMRPELEKMILKSDPHALGWARINGQVPHQESFQRTFGCEPGDKLYLEPGKQIRVW